MANDYAKDVAARVIAALGQGTTPWQKPWSPGELRAPFNPTTDKPYRGINSLWLQLQARADPRWLTYSQAAGEGAQVRKGETGTRIEYWKFHEDRPAIDANGKPALDETGTLQTVRVELDRPRRFGAVVFNAEQIDGLQPLPMRAVSAESERNARAEAILSASRAAIRHVEGNRAWYSPAADSITLPERQQFKSSDAFYATALHELGHWTGHASRLDRDLAHPFGSEGYAREELRAEIASLMLGERLEIGHDPGQHAAYVKSWIKALQDDPQEIFRAASAAEKITGYVLGFERQQAQTQSAGVVAEPASKPSQPVKQAAMTGERTFLAVPYREKTAAKAAGAKWDKDAKAWFAPPTTDLEATGLAKWLPTGAATPSAAPVANDPPEQLFADELRRMGFVIDGVPIMDGKMRRMPVEGDRGSERSGAYVGHPDGAVSAGFIQNFRTSEAMNWRAPADAVAPLSDPERTAAQATAAANRQKRETDIAEVRARARDAALALWAEAVPAPDSNAYCKTKGITGAAEKGLRVVPIAVSAGAQSLGLRIARDAREAKALRAADPETWVFQKGDLLVPLYDQDGALQGIQTATPFFTGYMRGSLKAGLHALAGGTPKSFARALAADPEMPIVIAEAYATADTVAGALGHPVIAALDPGNLDYIARQMRAGHPERALVFPVGNDHRAAAQDRRNTGHLKARQAAEAYGGAIAAPAFASAAAGTDWKKYAQAAVAEAAGATIREQVEKAKVEAAVASSRLRFYAHERMANAVDNLATSRDDPFVSGQRDKAQTTIDTATEAEAAITADADNLVAETSITATRADMSTLAQRGQNMADQVNEQRIEVLGSAKATTEADPEVQQATVRRSRGYGRRR